MNFTGIRPGLHRHRLRVSPVKFTEFPRVAEIIYTQAEPGAFLTGAPAAAAGRKGR
ncbi:hypothetical protein [Sorangium sp. So ce341]|uniref:hypothetical protein n=1 Tax=Sorangium sp. So ce341 TaxID=3133302 RepID=UPI003F60EB49